METWQTANGDGNDSQNGQPRPVITRLSDVEPEPVEWLWSGRSPLAKLSVLIGDPGIGKSFVTLSIAARHRVAVVCVSHLNKSQGTSALYRAIGSIGFVGPRIDRQSRRLVSFSMRRERTNNEQPTTHPTAELTPPRLAMRPREAAEALGISERLLWSLTSRGAIPHIKLGRAALYPVDVLRDWLVRRASNEGSRRSAAGSRMDCA